MADAEERDAAKQRDKDRNFEALKLYFEFFKHFTTLTTAAALIVIALQRQLGLELAALFAALFLWGFTLSQSLIGMGVILSQIVGVRLTLLVSEPLASRLRQRFDRIGKHLLPNPTSRNNEDPFRPPSFWMWLLMFNTVISFFAGLGMFILGASAGL